MNNTITKIENKIKELENENTIVSVAKAEGMKSVLKCIGKYVHAFNKLDEHFDDFHEEDKHEINDKLTEFGIYDDDEL